MRARCKYLENVHLNVATNSIHSTLRKTTERLSSFHYLHRVNQNFDEKSYINAKIKAIKYQRANLQLTA